MRRNRNVAPRTTSTRPSFMSRFRRRKYANDARRGRANYTEGIANDHHAGGLHVGTHGGTTAPVHYHKRHVTLRDKISGAMMRLRGSLTRRPGVKVCFMPTPENKGQRVCANSSLIGGWY
jgi:hypothetical protein